MPRTPDRFPGLREDEGVLLTPQATLPTVEGELRNVTGSGLRIFISGSETGLATTTYVEQAAATSSWKNPVRAATTANVTLSGAQTVDGVSLVAGERVLVKDQSTASQNGIYVVAAGSWSRALDADTNADVKAGLLVFVNEGTANGDTMFALTTNDPIVVGTTGLNFQPKGVSSGGGTSALGTFSFVADSFDTPDNSSWAVSSGAQTGTDPSISAIKLRGFDASSEEGVGFMLFVPATAVNFTLRLRSRALSPPGATQVVRIKLYHRGIPDNAAVPGTWTSFNGWADLTMPSTSAYQYDQETVSLATLGVTANRLYLFLLTRDAANAADTLGGDWGLTHMEVEFT
jgi:hypothetical protein